ncbi:hypothetical protein KW795_02945 [Candidatus Microgenomates bacterium]|nr:hypothetical protein [Candidatus Microgenomates bacterium]
MKYLLILVILVIGIAGGALGYKAFLEMQIPKVAIEPTTTPSNQEPLIQSPTPTAVTFGTVEGTLGYPAEGIPASMVVCAETLTNQKVKCTDKHIEDIGKYKSGQGYKLDLEAGEYYIYAQIPTNASYKAYYSEFVTCGLSVNCTSHKPLKVTVKVNETTKSIDPQDWYAPPGSQ